MAGRFISKPTYIEISKFQYEYEFIYDGQALRTGPIDRTMKLADVKDIFRARMDEYDQKRDVINFNKVDAFFSTDPVEL